MSAVLVTGAAGFVGQRVMRRLATYPDPIVAVDAVPIGGEAGDHSEKRVIDLARDPSDRLGAAMAGAESVIHLAWSHSEPGPASPGVPFPNLAALRRVLNEAGRAGVRRLVHVSSATVYGAWPDNPIPLAEDAALRPNPGFAYAVQKAEAERMVAEWADQHPDVKVAILRPSVTVGSSSPALYQALAGTRSPQAEESIRPMQFLDVEDLAGAVVFAWDHQLVGVYNVAPDGWLTHDQARAIVGGVARLRLPGRLAGTVASVGWRVLRTGTPTEALPYSIHPWVVANDRLRAAGWVPQRSNEEALVSSDDRSHWSDLSPSRRQELALVAAAGGMLAMLAGAVAGVAAVLGRARRRRRHR
ncbi:MAG TPA: NAD-dependent epimerase/dehydratase family protein [Acidimicrobiales bacterium]|nr:NAD-dependent epimerase/dehydratase family protein [Acidimicrobiales bacterium]